MARYIFITGGVVSSLGKGLASAALGALLQARGYSVRLRKLDPYLNVDPGTMSPFEHGEVFVTDDGAETDLDLGHYERFTGVPARKTDSVSSGRIYSNVLEKERRGDYLGKTIQVVPHVTNEIKEFLKVGDDEVDFMLCEIGGTVGDIEGLPFFEAIRQFCPRQTARPVHLHAPHACCPTSPPQGELKTKPTQHSVKELQSIGIAPDILVCRSEHPIPEKGTREDRAFLQCPQGMPWWPPTTSNPSMKRPLPTTPRASIRPSSTPSTSLPPRVPTWSVWHDVAMTASTTPKAKVRVAIVGKYTQLEDAYKSIARGADPRRHGQPRQGPKMEWVDAEIFDHEADDVAPHLEGYHAILVPGGFGERGTEGKIKAAQYARDAQRPLSGHLSGHANGRHRSRPQRGGPDQRRVRRIRP